MAYNLLLDRWIPTLHTNGTIYNRSIEEVINDSTCKSIVGNPTETFGVYRLLIALESIGLNYDLSTETFMQDVDPKGTVKPISYLTPDIPTGTNSLHFRHNCSDDNKYFCWQCIMRAICASPAFCTVGGQGLSPSINGAPPMYWLPVGENIRETIAINRISPIRSEWEKFGYTQIQSVATFDAFMFRPRRIHVFWLNRNAQCTRCGQFASLGAQEMIFAPGDKYVGEDWTDPHVLYNKKGNPVRAYGERTDWNQFVADTWKRDDIARPMLAWNRFSVFGAVTDKAKWVDAFQVNFTV